MSPTSRGTSSASAPRDSRLNERAVAKNLAWSGMTLSVVPAWKLPTVITTGSNTSNFLVTSVCNAVTISQATAIGSAARCGVEACPPRPCTVTVIWSAAASMAPPLVENVPHGSRFELTCSPKAATGRSPAASSTPSEIMCLAPA